MMNNILFFLIFCFSKNILASYSNIEIFENKKLFKKYFNKTEPDNIYTNIEEENYFKKILLNKHENDFSYEKALGYNSIESALIFYSKEMIFENNEQISYLALQNEEKEISFYKLKNYPKMIPFNEMEYYEFPPHKLHLNFIDLLGFNLDRNKIEEIIRSANKAAKLEFRAYIKLSTKSFNNELFFSFINNLKILSYQKNFKYLIKTKESNDTIKITFFIEIPYKEYNYFEKINKASDINFKLSNINHFINLKDLDIENSLTSKKIINKYFKDLEISDLEEKTVFDFGAGCECYRKRNSHIPSCLVSQLVNSKVEAFGIDICYKNSFTNNNINFSNNFEFVNHYKAIQESVTIDTNSFLESINVLPLNKRKADFVFSISLLCCLDADKLNYKTTPYNTHLHNIKNTKSTRPKPNNNLIDIFNKDNLKKTILNALSVLKKNGEARFYWNKHNHTDFNKTNLSDSIITKHAISNNRIYSDPNIAYIYEIIDLIKEVETEQKIIYILSYSLNEYYLFIKKNN